ncbi:MAG: HNH endonuclease signature motif containing protein [Pseudomonadota bacterium]
MAHRHGLPLPAYHRAADLRIADAKLDEALSAFREQWWDARQWGRRFTGVLPPLNGADAETARAKVHAHLWKAWGWRPWEQSKLLACATYEAIEAAHAEWQCGREKGPARSKRLRSMLRERDGDNCWVCGHELGHDCTIEHKQALANGGTWAFENLALAHRECNRALGRLPLKAKEAARNAIHARVR